MTRDKQRHCLPPPLRLARRLHPRHLLPLPRTIHLVRMGANVSPFALPPTRTPAAHTHHAPFYLPAPSAAPHCPLPPRPYAPDTCPSHHTHLPPPHRTLRTPQQRALPLARRGTAVRLPAQAAARAARLTTYTSASLRTGITNLRGPHQPRLLVRRCAPAIPNLLGLLPGSCRLTCAAIAAHSHLRIAYPTMTFVLDIGRVRTHYICSVPLAYLPYTVFNNNVGRDAHRALLSREQRAARVRRLLRGIQRAVSTLCTLRAALP